ncbi:PRD domain-containing protein [Salsuginibacillus kocurii]|uniref:PRD domain-containing protein n=1 Tax=Salsuginibacillus kocurii TaxID=427078 RepID=UPI0003737006|nr:PRD domain-containing protein [Salsuginibacillus kocurii]
MIIQKVLNNNAAIIKDQGQEKVALGSGLAFNKKKYDEISAEQVEKLFVMAADDQLKFSQLLHNFPESYVDVVREIVRRSEHSLGATFGDRLYATLFEHVSMAIERLQNGAAITNQLLPEIKILYAEEMEVALWAASLIEEKLGVKVPESEAGFIAMHLHTARAQQGTLREATVRAQAVQDMVKIIEEQLQVSFPKEHAAYQGLTIHLNLAVRAAQKGESLEGTPVDMREMVEKKYPQIYQSASQAMQMLQKDWSVELPADEVVYISMHVQRLLHAANETLK